MNKKFLKNLAIFGCIFNVVSCCCSINAMHNGGNDAHYINTVINGYHNADSKIKVMKNFLFDNKLPVYNRLVALGAVFNSASKDEKLDFISEVIKIWKEYGHSANTHVLSVFKTLDEKCFKLFGTNDYTLNMTKYIKKVYSNNDVFIETHLNASLSHPNEKTPLNIYVLSDNDAISIYFYVGNSLGDIGLNTLRPWLNPEFLQDQFYLKIRLGYDSPMWSGYASGDWSKELNWYKNQM